MNAYEASRDAKVAQNRAMMAAMGLQATAAQLHGALQQGSAPRPRQPRKRKSLDANAEPRRSGRVQGNPAPASLNEDELFRRQGVDYAAAGEEVRGGAARNVGGGRRAANSNAGTTCHWCRQKKEVAHVVCTHPDCGGGGGRLPISFCRMCIENRHGESLKQAMASDSWICPKCRGGCGEGCTTCCNCGPCRKRAGLGPTHRLIHEWTAAGFDNAHDFLIHRATGEDGATIAARKAAAPWGAWLAVPYDPSAAVEAEDDDEEGEGEEEEEAADAAVPRPPAPAPAVESEATITEGGAEEGDEEAGEGEESPAGGLFAGAPALRAGAPELTRKRKPRVLRMGLLASA